MKSVSAALQICLCGLFTVKLSWRQKNTMTTKNCTAADKFPSLFETMSLSVSTDLTVLSLCSLQ